MSETDNTKITEQQGEVVEESTATEQDIYSAQGYAALPTEDVGMEEGEENSYFESGYMTLPDDDPNEDKTPILYPSNYEDIANRQLEILEAQYRAVVNGSCMPEDNPINELKKKSSDLLPKPLDIVGDDSDEKPKKKAAKKPKAEKKKTWSREEILSTFLPPDKQQTLQRNRRNKDKPAVKKEKKPVPQVVIKEKKTEEKTEEMESKNSIIQSTMKSVHMDHKPKWARDLTEEEINDLVKKAAKDILNE
ncbi:hypothetical protein WA577_006388 [Blastocystis sp. JDR]